MFINWKILKYISKSNKQIIMQKENKFKIKKLRITMIKSHFACDNQVQLLQNNNTHIIPYSQNIAEIINNDRLSNCEIDIPINTLKNNSDLINDDFNSIPTKDPAKIQTNSKRCERCITVNNTTISEPVATTYSESTLANDINDINDSLQKTECKRRHLSPTEYSEPTLTNYRRNPKALPHSLYDDFMDNLTRAFRNLNSIRHQ